MKENLQKPVPYGNYLLLDRVNVGGMAEVFRAKSSSLEGIERLVAIKRILPHLARDPDFSNMFIDEARIAINLRHANIAQMYELSRVGESLYIAMEYVHGRDLRGLINRMRYLRRDLPIPMVAHIISKVCEGLDYAHRKRDDLTMCDMNIVHRDVSPQNVIISYEGEVKIIDFGIAKAASKRSHTEAGILKGKFGYMAPEQVAGGDIDRRADVFCIGILMYELLTTDRLFAGSSELSTLRRIRNVEVAPPSMLNRAIPDELEEIVLKTLAAQPEDRYVYASDLSDDLQRFLQTTQSEVFAARQLRSFMHDVFAKDINDDQKTLEALLRVSPKELPAPSRENNVWQESPPSSDSLSAQKPHTGAVQQAGQDWREENASFPNTPATNASRQQLMSSHQQAEVQEIHDEIPLSSADYQFTDDDETRSLVAHPDPVGVSFSPSSPAVPSPFEPIPNHVPVASPTPRTLALLPEQLLAHSLPPLNGQEALSGLGHANPAPAHPLQYSHEPQHLQHPQQSAPHQKPGRALIWIFLWFLLGGLFLGMVYLLFFFPVPGVNPLQVQTPKISKRGGVFQPPTPQARPDVRTNPILPIPRLRPRIPTRRVLLRKQPPVSRRLSKRNVKIESIPSRALLYIEGRLYGRTPSTVKLSIRRKSYRLVLRKPGYRSSSHRVRVNQASGALSVRLHLNRIRRNRRVNIRRTPPRRRISPSQPPPRRKQKGFGYLTIKGAPIARIYINGIDTGRYLLYKRKMPAGTYKIHFVTSEGDVWETRVTLKAGQGINRVSRYKKK